MLIEKNYIDKLKVYIVDAFPKASKAVEAYNTILLPVIIPLSNVLSGLMYSHYECATK